MDEWQPIETAPRDGTWIVVLIPESIQDDSAPSPLVETARWIKEEVEVWRYQDSETKKRILEDRSHWSNREEPTHWTPLPEIPKD